MRHIIGNVLRVVSAPVVEQLPLFVLWLLGLSLGGLLDLERLHDIEFPTVTYVLELLRIVCYNLCLSALLASVVAAMARAVGRRWLRWLLALVAIIMLGVCLFVRYHYGTRLTPEIATVIRETNRSEATEYLATYVFSSTGLPVMVALLAAMLAFVLFDNWWNRRGHQVHRWLVVVAAIAVPIMLLGSVKMALSWPMADRFLNRQKGHYENFGTDALTNMMLCDYMLNRVDEQVVQSISASEQAFTRPAAPLPADSLSLVLVIGESYIKSHASIYGYPLPTTSHQQEERDAGRLVVMSDMVSPYSYTNMAMRAMLSTNNESQGQQWYDFPLVMALFKHAGYQVSMWDNQREFMQGTVNTRGLNGLMYHPRIMQLCYDDVNDQNFEFDGQLVEDFASHEHTAVHQLVIFHLRGQHIKAERRYPHTKEWMRFSPGDYHRSESFIDSEALQQIAHYDNATRYNDAVLAQVFSLFANRQSIVVYLPDHGDEIYDYRGSLGRRDDNKHPELMVRYQHEVPMVVWCSSPLIAAHPQLMGRLRQAAMRPGTTDNLSQMLLGLSGIATPYYQSRLDILSPDYRCPKRMVRGKYDYDELLGKQGQ